MFKKLFHLPYRIFIARKSGLNKTPKDTRDFNLGIFGFGDYEPKHESHIITTLSTKDQESLNTCQWNATTTAKEVDEKCKLSVRSIVIKGQELGYISSNGYSNLRDGQKVLQKWGILKEGIIDETVTSNWKNYSNINAIKGLDNEAAKHKISSYWTITSRNEILKQLDENKCVITGINWYTGFNMGGGFRYPWLISSLIGLFVGGHAITIVGYKLNYEGRKVYVCKNSFGGNWGNYSLFYIDMSFLEKDNYGFYVNLDEVDKELGGFLTSYDGKNVKGSGPTIYFLQKGKLKAYPDELTYLSFNVKDNLIGNWNLIDDRILDKVEKGDNMEIEKSLYWDYLKGIKNNEARLNKLIQIMTKP